MSDLCGFIAEAACAGAVTIERDERLAGGAIQENRAIDAVIDGTPTALVLRTEAKAPVPASRAIAEQFALLGAARAAGVTVPEPLWLCEDAAVTGRPFFIMRRIAGIALGNRVVRAGPHEALAATLGAELARIHAIAPPRTDLAFLGTPPASPALAGIEIYRGYLDAEPMPHPAIEWGLRWLERNAPPGGEIVLAHHDFRTGNYMIDGRTLTGILDWEFAGWSDPMEDVAWFCAKCWRFGANHLEAGGIAARTPFYRAYEAASGRTIDAQMIYYWEVTAHVRWAVIAVQQAGRHLSGREPDLELALIGRKVAELEHEILAMTEGP